MEREDTKACNTMLCTLECKRNKYLLHFQNPKQPGQMCGTSKASYNLWRIRESSPGETSLRQCNTETAHRFQKKCVRESVAGSSTGETLKTDYKL